MKRTLCCIVLAALLLFLAIAFSAGSSEKYADPTEIAAAIEENIGVSDVMVSLTRDLAVDYDSEGNLVIPDSKMELELLFDSRGNSYKLTALIDEKRVKVSPRTKLDSLTDYRSDCLDLDNYLAGINSLNIAAMQKSGFLPEAAGYELRPIMLLSDKFPVYYYTSDGETGPQAQEVPPEAVSFILFPYGMGQSSVDDMIQVVYLP